MVIQFKDYLRKNSRWLIPLLAVLLLLCSSISIYASGLWSLPVIGGSGTYVVGGTTPSIFIIGNYTVSSTGTSIGNILYIVIPLFMAVIGLIAIVLRIKTTSSAKTIFLTGAIAIFVILAFIIIRNLVELINL